LKDEKSKEAFKEMYTNTKSDIQSLVLGKVLDEIEYHNFGMKYGTLFEAGIGAEAIFKLFKEIDMQKLLTSLHTSLEKAGALESLKLKQENQSGHCHGFIWCSSRMDVYDSHSCHATCFATNGSSRWRTVRNF